MEDKENINQKGGADPNVRPDNSSEDAERIDAIKKLIFGENMAEYDHRFEALFDRLENYHKEFEMRLMGVNQKLISDMQEMKQKFESRVELLQKEINNHLDKIEDDKTDRREFGKMLQAIAENLMK